MEPLIEIVRVDNQLRVLWEQYYISGAALLIPYVL
jgi:hypothetical protein